MDTFLEGLRHDPLAQLEHWLGEARAAGIHEPEAMTLATATHDAVPSARMVLLRGHDERGLTFFTNRESRKGADLAANPRAALVLHWAPLERQVRVEGTVEVVGDEESFAYFRTRARESRIGAWASPQSRPVADRAELERRVTEVEERFPGSEDVPLPPFWGGYRVVPVAFEFWQSRAGRLHDRVRYVHDGAEWQRARLGP